jgi:murein DD-endopeptidase MepM/ murein hydrolase activator NlpD
MDEFPGSEDDPSLRSMTSSGANSGGDQSQENWILATWEGLSRAGLGETVLRAGTHLLSIALVVIVIWAMRSFYLYLQKMETASQVAGAQLPKEAAFAAEMPTPTPTALPPVLPPFSLTVSASAGIPRLAVLHTTIPSRPRTEVTTYTVVEGDTIFGIAEKYGLKPETILWGNTYILGDNPHNLIVGQELNILPVDGTYHRWSAGEGLNGVARGYDVTPEDIINWKGNQLDPATLGDWSNPNIEPGTMLVVPGGQRAFVTWSAPRISRTNPGVARLLGPGSCGTVVDGAVGSILFIWPSNNHYLSGYDYSPSTNHYGIDIAGSLGDALYASDNGVVVYAGWNNHGYGNVVVIDHGFGWQTLYAHMSVISVVCGQSVFQGGVIGSMGSTGKSSGPHLHFEMLNEAYGKVNPWNFLPPP